MTGLAKETPETFKETMQLCEAICQNNLRRKGDPTISMPELLTPTLGPMILLDPGSLAFDFPRRYGYHILFKNFYDYYQAMYQPHWYYWISYETVFLSRRDLFEMVLRSLEFMVDLKEKYGFQSSGGLERGPAERGSVDLMRFNINSDRVMIEEIESVLRLGDPDERVTRLRALGEALKECRSIQPQMTQADPYGYRRKLESVVHQSVGLIDGY